MRRCRHAAVCGLDAVTDERPYHCILHAQDPAKDRDAFSAALATHRKSREGRFDHFVFPGAISFGITSTYSGETIERRMGEASFFGAVFLEEAHFGGAVIADAIFVNARFRKPLQFNTATISDRANFGGAWFEARANFAGTRFGEAWFGGVRFEQEVEFGGATFTGDADFVEAVLGADARFQGVDLARADFTGAAFKGGAVFTGATFSGPATFGKARFDADAAFDGTAFRAGAGFEAAAFGGSATFAGATFAEAATWTGTRFCAGVDFTRVRFGRGADFRETAFERGTVSFRRSVIGGPTVFTPREEAGRLVPVFQGVDVDFREVAVDPPDALALRDVDLTRARLLDTDLRKAELTGITWPSVQKRSGVFDELDAHGSREDRPWSRIEQLCRTLKQSYEDRKDYERAGDFHFAEKEARRRNPATSRGSRLLLTLYWLTSGYGERYVRPLLWAAALLVAGSAAYLLLGIEARGSAEGALDPRRAASWLRTVLFSLETMALLRPTDLARRPDGPWPARAPSARPLRAGAPPATPTLRRVLEGKVHAPHPGGARWRV
jgi:uncharacterized protein YjbI with pentapeptide repeats